MNGRVPPMGARVRAGLRPEQGPTRRDGREARTGRSLRSMGGGRGGRRHRGPGGAGGRQGGARQAGSRGRLCRMSRAQRGGAAAGAQGGCRMPAAGCSMQTRPVERKLGRSVGQPSHDAAGAWRPRGYFSTVSRGRVQGEVIVGRAFVLPFYSPCGFLDRLSGGRENGGVGVAGTPPSGAAWGVLVWVGCGVRVGLMCWLGWLGWLMSLPAVGVLR